MEMSAGRNTRGGRKSATSKDWAMSTTEGLSARGLKDSTPGVGLTGGNRETGNSVHRLAQKKPVRKKDASRGKMIFTKK